MVYHRTYIPFWKLFQYPNMNVCMWRLKSYNLQREQEHMLKLMLGVLVKLMRITNILERIRLTADGIKKGIQYQY